MPCDLSSMLVCWNGESLRTEGTSPFGRRIGECVKEHVDSMACDGVPMELVRHVAFEVKDEL